MLPRHFNHIVESKVLRVGYLKSPDVAFEVGNDYDGYEYQLLKKFADAHDLTIKLTALTQEEIPFALNLSKIDIALGGFTQASLDPRLYRTSQPWESQTFTVVERREANVAADKKVDAPVTLGQRHAGMNTQNLPDIEFIQSTLTELELFDKLSNGQISLVGTTLARLRILQRYFPTIRRVRSFKEQLTDVVWLFGKRANDSFVDEINAFIEQPATIVFQRELSNKLFKTSKYLHYLDTLRLSEHAQDRLPKYQRWFRQAGREYDIDWTLLAAIAYQESKWTVDAVSPTKVRGLMQITTQTAKELGIENRLDPFSSIFAASKYLNDLRARVPKRVSEPDRTWMAIAAYNVGFGNVMKAYRKARKGNYQAITWQDMVRELPRLRINNVAAPLTDEVDYDENQTFARGLQAVKYVARVREFAKILRYYAAE